MEQTAGGNIGRGDSGGLVFTMSGADAVARGIILGEPRGWNPYHLFTPLNAVPSHYNFND